MEDDKEKSNKDDNEKCEVLSSENQQFDYNYKIIIIGNTGVGKTCLTIKASTDQFDGSSVPTLSFDFLAFYIRYKGKTLKLEIWDTCGQEEYRSIIKSYFANASLAVMVYAIDDSKSFNSIEEWIRQLKSQCSPETKIFLIGNKADLEDK